LVAEPGRILGIDAGERRIGVAISDPGCSFALPLDSILADGGEFDRLAELVAREGVSDLVVGLPLSLSGEDSAQTGRARAFASKAEQRLALAVHMWDERWSSHEAERLIAPEREGRGRDRNRRGGGRGGGRPATGADTDALAASIILQAYLDSLRFATHP
jgi:putative Holliday junction resolvase